MNPLSSALVGLSKADEMMSAASDKIARGGDPTEALVQMSMAKVQQEATLAATQAISDTLGTLVNTYA